MQHQKSARQEKCNMKKVHYKKVQHGNNAALIKCYKKRLKHKQMQNQKSATWKKYKKIYSNIEKSAQEPYIIVHKWIAVRPGRNLYTLVHKITGNILNVEGNIYYQQNISLREKYPFSELFWSVFSRFRTKYWILCIQPECGNVRTRITLKTDTFYELSANKLREPSANKFSAFKT